MRRRVKRPVLAALAAVFAAATLLYSGLWIYAAVRGVPVELGFDNKYFAADHCELAQSVYAGSPAESAGMKAGDCILKVNDIPLQAEDTLSRIWFVHNPGDRITLTIRRPGEPHPVVLQARFRAATTAGGEAGVAQDLGRDINNAFPIAFFAVGLAVLFLRLDDPNAWLLALLFAGFIAVPSFPNSYLLAPAPVRPLAMAYHATFNSLVTAFFYFFFSTFPARSPLDRRVPWLKWVGLVIGVAVAIPALKVGDRGLVTALNVGHRRLIIALFDYALVVLGFVSLIWNAVSVKSPEAQRKIRVILWGTVVGVGPATLVLAANDFLKFYLTLWMGAAVVLLLWIFPLSFAYAVVKHRVLEIPVLLRRSARYLLVQRGFAVLLILLSVAVTLAFALAFSRYLRPLTAAAVPEGVALGTAFGGLLLWTGTRVHRDVGRRIDRAFFRNAYDERVILEDLVHKTRTAGSRRELAALLQKHLTQALRPSSLAIYLETADGLLSRVGGDFATAPTIRAADPELAEVTRRAVPWEISENGDKVPIPPALLPLRPECLVPILGRDSRLVGLIGLGMRLSEEPYSREDASLLRTIANQTGVAVEGIRLGEKVAERIEAERRAAQEMEFARQVQMRLLPQNLPPMRTLEYIGVCLPARTVGGDYYDFLELRPGRLGLVLADIAGKGVPGALLMANLQANLRSQYALAVDDLPRLLGSVNRLFYQATDTASYATLLFADYDDSNRLLRYANCGHLPGLLVRRGASGCVERLRATSTVLGLFADAQPEVAELTLAPGDTLILYTDGITETANADGEEFGESRLLDCLHGQCHSSATALAESVVTAVRQFSSGEQEDDITLVIAKCLA